MASSRDAADAVPAPEQGQNQSDAPREPPSYQDHLKRPASTVRTGPASSENMGDAPREPPSHQDHLKRPASTVRTGPASSENMGDAPREPPSYQDHLKRPASTVRTGPASSENMERRGGSATVSPIPPSKYARPNAHEGNGLSGDGLPREPSSTIGANVWSRRKDAMKAELKSRKWELFAVGNVISAAVVISEMSKLDVCFDDDLEDSDDPTTDDAERAAEIESAAASTEGFLLTILIFGLWVDVFSAVALSMIYRSPLDIKSVNKILPNDMRHCGGSVMVHFLAPLSWAIIYTFGGMAGVFYWIYSPCDGQEGEGLRLYLLFSGLFMLLVGLVLLALSVFILPFACGSPTDRTDRCCSAFRRKVHKYVLSKGRFLEIFWKVQGAVWAFRSGRFGLLGFFFAATGGIVGDVMAACGSLTPEVVQVLAGPLG